jgi:hypothetical protein
MERWTLSLVVAIVAICVVALAVAIGVRATQPPPDLTTPEGVATAYILAIQQRDPDRAWDLLDSPQAVGSFGPRGETPTREAFRQQVLNFPRPENRRLRILGATPSGETARVEIQVTFLPSGPPFLGMGSGMTQTRIVELRRREGTWRITSTPPIWDL